MVLKFEKKCSNNFVGIKIVRIFALDFKSEITKRYACSVYRNLGNSNAMQNQSIAHSLYSVGLFHLLIARFS